MINPIEQLLTDLPKNIKVATLTSLNEIITNCKGRWSLGDDVVLKESVVIREGVVLKGVVLREGFGPVVLRGCGP